MQKRSSNKGKCQPRAMLTRYKRGRNSVPLSSVPQNPVVVRKGRVIINNVRQRPRCPVCSTGLSSTWTTCSGCKSPIIWE